MTGRNHWQEGFQQGLENGKKVRNQKEMEKALKTVYSKYTPRSALEYMKGYLEGFSKSNMASTNQL